VKLQLEELQLALAMELELFEGQLKAAKQKPRLQPTKLRATRTGQASFPKSRFLSSALAQDALGQQLAFLQPDAWRKQNALP